MPDKVLRCQSQQTSSGTDRATRSATRIAARIDGEPCLDKYLTKIVFKEQGNAFD
jgi:hypothetical protein